MPLLTEQWMSASVEPQFLDIISLNVWNILISLLNLVILFLIVKRFLFRPVKRLFAERQAALEHQYAAAAEAQRIADERRDAWEQRLQSAEAEADTRIAQATDSAERRAAHIVDEATERAKGIVNRAQTQAALERKRAMEDMKREIVDIGTIVAQTILQREINEMDHRAMIEDVMEQIGESHDADRG